MDTLGLSDARAKELLEKVEAAQKRWKDQTETEISLSEVIEILHTLHKQIKLDYFREKLKPLTEADFKFLFANLDGPVDVEIKTPAKRGRPAKVEDVANA